VAPGVSCLGGGRGASGDGCGLVSRRGGRRRRGPTRLSGRPGGGGLTGGGGPLRMRVRVFHCSAGEAIAEELGSGGMGWDWILIASEARAGSQTGSVIPTG
jgi:hypothetical protein